MFSRYGRPVRGGRHTDKEAAEARDSIATVAHDNYPDTGRPLVPPLVGALLQRYIKEQEIAPSHVAILCGKSVERGAFADSHRCGGIGLTSNQKTEPKKVLLETIHSFKGLERRVVILTDIDQISARNREELLYVGITRARTHLAVVAEEDTLRSLSLGK